MFIYHLLKTIIWIKGLLEKVCNMLYKYSLSETFRRFVLLKIVEYLHFFTPPLLPPTPYHHPTPHPSEIPNACLILEKHVRVLFEGNILLTAWLQDLHRASLTELTSFFSSAGDFSPELFSLASVIHAQVLVFLLWQTETFTGFFPFLSAVFCEQTITCWRNNKPLLGMTSWEFCF